MRHTLSKGQRKLWGHCFNFFVIGQNMRKIDAFMHRKVKNYKFSLFLTQNIASFSLKQQKIIIFERM